MALVQIGLLPVISISGLSNGSGSYRLLLLLGSQGHLFQVQGLLLLLLLLSWSHALNLRLYSTCWHMLLSRSSIYEWGLLRHSNWEWLTRLDGWVGVSLRVLRYINHPRLWRLCHLCRSLTKLVHLDRWLELGQGQRQWLRLWLSLNHRKCLILGILTWGDKRGID